MSGEFDGKAVSLAGLVEYQAGSVVSREVVKKPTGTATVFAFDAGQGLSEHTAPFDAVVQVLEGRAEIVIAGKPFEVSAGQAIIMPANVPHAVNATDKFKMLLTMIKE